MKLFAIIFSFISCNCMAQVYYQIHQEKIILSLSNNLDSNNTVIEKIKSDPTALKCVELSISGNFETIPNNLYDLNWIVDLKINSTKPIYIDKGFSRFKSLKSLMIFSQMKGVDQGVKLPVLDFFSCVNSGLSEFPIAICNWGSLTEVDLQKGTFPAIPKEIKKLKNLKRLNFSDNKISQLPMELGALEKLEVLGLGANNLKTLPSSICQLKKLQELYVLSNPNLVIPEEQMKCIKTLPQFKELYLE